MSLLVHCSMGVFQAHLILPLINDILHCRLNSSYIKNIALHSAMNSVMSENSSRIQEKLEEIWIDEINDSQQYPMERYDFPA